MTNPSNDGTGSPHGGPVYRFFPSPTGQSVARRGRDFGLGRHVNHDPASRAYAYRAGAPALAPVRHERRVPIFDQGGLGSCVPNAGLGILGTEPYYSALRAAGLLTADGNAIVLPETVTGAEYWGPGRIPFTESGAIGLYREVTADDPFPGAYPPDDTGSDGLSMAKVFAALGLVPGYQHTFDLASALTALQTYPLLGGTEWTNDMFDPDPYGRVRPTGTVAGGHEWIVDEYLPTSRYGVPMVGCTTSWSESFGADGRFFLIVSDFGKLLKADGDVIVLTPPNKPAPQPGPVGPPEPAADQALAAAMRTWLTAKGL
jgi:hypothetical protein